MGEKLCGSSRTKGIKRIRESDGYATFKTCIDPVKDTRIIVRQVLKYQRILWALVNSWGEVHLAGYNYDRLLNVSREHGGYLLMSIKFLNVSFF
jgi:hypothetical protein